MHTTACGLCNESQNMIHDFDPIRKELTKSALSQTDRLPFKIAPVMLPDPTDPQREGKRRTHRSAMASVLYVRREAGADRFGAIDYRNKAEDLVCHGRQHPVARFPAHLRTCDRVWQEADTAAAADPALPAAMHVIASLPDGQPEDWQRLVTGFLDDMFVSRGMICEWAAHALRGEGRSWQISPHVHVIATSLSWRNDKRPGKRQKSWLFSADQVAAAETEWLLRTGLTPLTYSI